MSPKLRLKKQLKNLPPEPGVYIFKGAGGEALYVGKATRLSDRVPQHFREARTNSRKKALINATWEIQTIIFDNEKAAVRAEYDLIKQLKPQFNIVHCDDKSYPFIRITTEENYPRVLVTRERHTADSDYFGPYTDVSNMRRTLKAIRDIFPYRSCNLEIPVGGDPDRYRPCLDYSIKQCEAPCVGFQTIEEYGKMIEQISKFLRGRYQPVKNYLEQQMQQFSDEKKFEAAAVYRDRLHALKKMIDKSPLISSTRDADFLAIGTNETAGIIVILKVRDNRLVNRIEFPLTFVGDSPEQALRDFIATYYPVATEVPPLLLLPREIPDRQLLAETLSELSNQTISIKIPRRGEKLKLIRSASRTAKLAATNEALSQRRKEGDLLLAVKDLLELPVLPTVVEGFDISTFQGKQTVASMVRFISGTAEKRGYRRFRISKPAAQDDFAALQEVVRRRYKRIIDEQGQLPDLVFVDGGAGQLSSVKQVLKEFQLAIPVISLAKREEILYVNDPHKTYNLPEDSKVLQLFQRIRDEAHRFAINYHRDRRRMGISSNLREIKGIGEKRLKSLIKRFGSPTKVREAPIEELQSVPGITADIAKKIKQQEVEGIT